MKRFAAILLLILFNLGAFGVSIERHLCCHSHQEESTLDHCTDDESCCDQNEDCCDEIVSQVKIPEDYNSQQFKLSLEFHAIDTPGLGKFYDAYVIDGIDSNPQYTSLAYFLPQQDIYSLYSTFLI